MEIFFKVSLHERCTRWKTKSESIKAERSYKTLLAVAPVAYENEGKALKE